MAEGSPDNLIHTPSQGFVDIKPLLNQPEWVTRASQSFLLILAGIAAYYLGRSIINRFRSKQKPTRVSSPLEKFEELAAALKDAKLTVREFSESLSIAVRSFCDLSFFPDSDTCVSCTVRELEMILRPVIFKKLPVYPVAKKNESVQSLLVILKKLEDGAYSDMAAMLDSTGFREELLDAVSMWVKNIATELDREYKRTLLVTDSQNSNTAPRELP